MNNRRNKMYSRASTGAGNQRKRLKPTRASIAAARVNPRFPDSELTDVIFFCFCADIFYSVAIYGWRGSGALTGTIYIELAPRCYLL